MIPMSGTVSKGWLAKYLDVAFDYKYYFDPDVRYNTDAICSTYIKTSFNDLNIFNSESNLGQINFITQDQVLIGGIQPNMILGMLIGADFQPANERDADISATPLKGLNINDVPNPENVLQHDLIMLFDSQIRDIQSKGKLTPIPPFFWDVSGRATVHGALTTAQKFLGENVFIDLMMQPDKIVAVMDWITQCYIMLAKHFSDLVHLPITSVHVGECSGSMVDAAMFESFVAPQSHNIAKALGPLRFHTCGPSTHLLPGLKKAADVAALDLGGETSLTEVRKLYGPNLHVDIAPLATDLSASTSESMLAWAQRVVAENAGGSMRVVYHLEPDYNLDSIYALHGYLKTV